MKLPAFLKVHFAAVLFILINMFTGGAMNKAQIYNPIIQNLHFISGLFIFLAPAAVFLMLKNKTALAKSFYRLVTLNRKVFQDRDFIGILVKTTATLFVIQLVVFAITGISMKFLPELFPQLASIAHRIHVLNADIILYTFLLHLGVNIVKKIRKSAAKQKQQKTTAV